MNFRYYEDKLFANPDRSCHPDGLGNPGQRPFPITLDQIQARYPFTIDQPDPPPGICDSNDDIELNAVLLDEEVAVRGSQFDGVTIVANSGGGAIVRAYLSYAARSGTGTLAKLEAVFLLEGVEHGTYLMAAYNGSALPNSDNPVVSSVRDFILRQIRDGVGHDPNRPAAQDFTPQTSLISFYNQTALIPDQPHYVNVVGDINVHVSAQVLFFTIPAGDLAIGDGVMLPGRDNPSDVPLPPLGGARFLPSTVGRGASSTQWVLTKDYEVVLGSIAAPAQFANVLNDPAIHLNLSRMHEICVDVPLGTGTGIKRLDDALIDAFTALDALPPAAGRIGFGNTNRVACP